MQTCCMCCLFWKPKEAWPVMVLHLVWQYSHFCLLASLLRTLHSTALMDAFYECCSGHADHIPNKAVDL